MNKFLSSGDCLNVEESEAYISRLADKRERAFVHFMIGQAMFAVGGENVQPPMAPVDFLYLAEIARTAYKKKQALLEIIKGDVDDVLWGEEI